MLTSILIFIGGFALGFLAGLGAITYKMKMQVGKAQENLEDLANMLAPEEEDEVDKS